jgi:hypothetical protein
MTNEMKLLKAFIEVSGFEIEETRDYEERKITAGQHATNILVMSKMDGSSIRRERADNGKYLIDDDGMYTSYLINPIIDYKVTKKEAKS